MPGNLKHVRFAPTSIAYPPHRSVVPHLSHSISTASSSAGLKTPPNHPHTYLPPSSVHKPAPAPLLHPVLSYSRTSSINFDISHPPTLITTPHGHALSPKVLAESATNPPLLSLTLFSPHLPWSIHVRPASSKPGAFVTVADVFAALYRALRNNITQQDYNTLPSIAQQHRAKGAYEKRYRRIRDQKASAEEKKHGMKRIDFLMGRNRFMGLSSSSKGADVWYFNVT